MTSITRLFVLAGVSVLASAVTSAQPQAPAQPASSGPRFEAVSIKRNTGNETQGGSYRMQPSGRFVMVNGQLRALVETAYPTNSGEVIGLPEWAWRERYDVSTVAAGHPGAEELQLMFRALVAERMNLVAHYKEEEREAYALVLARSDGRLGPQMRRIDADCGAVVAAARAGTPLQVRPAPSGMPPCRTSMSMGTIRTSGMTMARLARSIPQTAGRFIVDKTGLAGDYEFTLRYASQLPDAPATDAALDDQPSIFVALEEQLGLKLVPDRAIVQVLVIDRIERPSEN